MILFDRYLYPQNQIHLISTQNIQKKIMQKASEPHFLKHFPFKFVLPYAYTFKTYAKQRWYNRPILDVMVKQFKAYDEHYYQQCIQIGKIKVNGKVVDCAYKIKNGDQIDHQTIRKQPPVLNLPIRVIEEDDKIIAIEKPPSWTIHTGGGYHYNTIDFVLKNQLNFKSIYILHRLDKLTSGLVLLAKQSTTVTQFHEANETKTMKKMYFARVSGEVEWQERQFRGIIQCISHKEGMYKVIQEIKEDAEKEGKSEPDIKDSRTFFKKVWYDKASDSTLLEAYPITGRTHQIRVHLQFLGHPILNDTCYGGRFVGNPIIKQIEQEEGEQEEKITKKVKVNEGFQIDIESWDYKTRPLQIMLHSYRYKLFGKQYQAKKPYWYEPQAIQIYKEN